MSASYIPPPSLPLTGGTLTGRLNSVGITDLGTELFGDQTPVTAVGLPVNQMAVGYAPTNFPAASTIEVLIAASSAVSASAGSTNVLFQARNTATGSNPMSVFQCLKFDAIYGSSGALTAVRGAQGTARATGGATITQLEGVSSQLFSSNSSAVTNGYTFFANPPSIASSGTIATAYGFYANGMKVTGVTAGVAFFSIGATDVSMLAGSLAVGKTTTPLATLDVNGAILRKTFTVATLSTGVVGMASFVSDALGPTFGAAVVGGGAVQIPVYYDGAWKVG